MGNNDYSEFINNLIMKLGNFNIMFLINKIQIYLNDSFGIYIDKSLIIVGVVILGTTLLAVVLEWVKKILPFVALILIGYIILSL